MSEEVVVEQKSGKGLLIALIGILLVLIIAIVVAVILLLGGEKEAEQNPVQVTTKEQPKSNIRSSDYARLGPLFSIPNPFVINLSGQNGRRYAKVSVALELSAVELQQEVTAKLPLIQDTIIRVISSKTFEEVSTPKGKDKLKEELTQEINTFILDGYIKSVFFTEFVIQ